MLVFEGGTGKDENVLTTRESGDKEGKWIYI